MSVQARQFFTDAKERAKALALWRRSRLPTRPKLRMLSSAPLEDLDGSEPDIPRTIHVGWPPRGARAGHLPSGATPRARCCEAVSRALRRMPDRINGLVLLPVPPEDQVALEELMSDPEEEQDRE
jgi:hypothetical protein